MSGKAFHSCCWCVLCSLILHSDLILTSGACSLMTMVSLLEHPSCKLGFQCSFIPGERIPVLSAARADAENPSGLAKTQFSICTCPRACQGLETNLGSHKLIFWFCEQLFAEGLRKLSISGQHWALLTGITLAGEGRMWNHTCRKKGIFNLWTLRLFTVGNKKWSLCWLCVYPCGRYESSGFDLISFPLGKEQSNKVI